MSETKTRLVVDQVHPDHIDRVFPLVSDLLEKGLEFSRGRFDIRYVYNCLSGAADREWYLWVAFDRTAAAEGEFKPEAAIVTGLSLWPTGLKVAEVILVGGKGPADEWLHHVDVLKKWATRNECDRLEIIGRKGWQKRTRDMGLDWKPVAMMFEHDLKAE